MNTDLLRDLQAAHEGSAELSVRVYRLLTGDNTYCVGGREGPECGREHQRDGRKWWAPVPCITTSLDVAIDCIHGAAREAYENAHGRKMKLILLRLTEHDESTYPNVVCRASIGTSGLGNWEGTTYSATAKTMPLAICAAILKAIAGQDVYYDSQQAYLAKKAAMGEG